MKSKILNKTTLLILTSATVMLCFLYIANKEYNLFNITYTEIELLHKNCLQSMKDNTCVIMSTPESDIVSSDAKEILIAGYGPLDIGIYKNLRNNPILMCDQIKQSCEVSKKSDLCRLGHVLYPSKN